MMTRSLRRMCASVCGALLLVLVGRPAAAQAKSPEWAGVGSHRILVEVDAIDVGSRESDETVASCLIDFAQAVPAAKGNARVDLNRLQVIKYDPESGKALPYAMNEYQLSPHDRPWRFYDKTLGDEFPTYNGYISADAQRNPPTFKQELLPFGHRVFNSVSDGRVGTVAWAHTAERAKAGHYAIYFDLLGEGAKALVAPAGFIGDGSNRIVKESRRAGPPGNVAGHATDWNGDGLTDILFGAASAYLMVLENTGTLKAPRFERRELLFDADGKPIDVGYDSFPYVADWNGDGLPDVLVGAERGCIVYYRNEGTRTHPKLVSRGFIETDGRMLETPNWPIAELVGKEPGATYKKDYVALPCAVDWDEDGDLDLLAGGFVTGYVFYHENVGNRADGTPELRSRGPLEADGQPLDTGWEPSPNPVDLDNDGDLDLVCGAKPITPQGGDVSDPDLVFYYFENVGTRRAPRLVRRPFPSNGPSFTGQESQVTVTDWNGDGLYDLTLVTRGPGELFLIPNIGTKQKPLFDMNVKHVPGHWNNAQLAGGDFIDWNGDSWPDILSSSSVSLNDKKGLPGHFGGERINIMPQGSISHPHPHGDENPGIEFFDFDKDGDIDCIYGTHSGHIYLHENRGTNARPDWDMKGRQLHLANGAPIKVGFPEGHKPETFDFTVLQGARPKLTAADFNQDGMTDLIIGDTFGKVRYFQNVSKGEDPAFADPVMVCEIAARTYVKAVKWDDDPHPDILVIRGTSVQLLLNKTSAGKAEFAPPQKLKLPATIGGIYDARMVDYNRDGDEDILFDTSHRLTAFVERSFMRHGYTPARVIASEVRAAAGPAK